MGKARAGNFFEDFHVGQGIRHATPRTIGEGDAALYLALTGSRFLQHCCDPFARANGLPRAPVEDLLAFHTVFGKTVPDVSLNAVANLGYADARFLAPVYPGDTLGARSEVIGLKENSSGRTGIVWVRSKGRNRRRTRPRLCALGDGEKTRCRRPAPDPVVPELPEAVAPERLVVPAGLRAAGSTRRRRLALLPRGLRGASGSTTWTGWASPRPSTGSPPGSTRTRRGCTSTTTSSGRAGWVRASSTAAS